jgi:hypothetical protein
MLEHNCWNRKYKFALTSSEVGRSQIKRKYKDHDRVMGSSGPYSEGLLVNSLPKDRLI